jgi:hypothetical protein
LTGLRKIGELTITGTPDDAVGLIKDVARDMGLEVHVVEQGKEVAMGQISISVDGTLVPESGTKAFTRSVEGGDAEAHKAAYADARTFLDEAEAELKEPA